MAEFQKRIPQSLKWQLLQPLAAFNLPCFRFDAFAMNPTITIRLEDGPRSIPQGQNLAALLVDLNQAEKEVSTAVNGRFVPRSQRAATVLQEGDEVLVFQAIVGG